MCCWSITAAKWNIPCVFGIIARAMPRVAHIAHDVRHRNKIGMRRIDEFDYISVCVRCST